MLETEIERLTNEINTLNSQLRQWLILQEPRLAVDLASPKSDKTVTAVVAIEDGEVVDITSAEDSIDISDPLIEWDNVDVMGCPFHPTYMSGSRKVATTGKHKGCWNKIKSADYPQEMYLDDRRQLIAAAEERTPVETVEAVPVAPVAPVPVAPVAPVPVAPAPIAAAGPVNDPSADFLTVVQRHVGKYGDEQLKLRLRQCGMTPDYDVSLLADDDQYEPDFKAQVEVYIRQELVKNDAEQA